MAISERERRAVFVKLEAVLGEETADSLMQMLPRATNDELATRSDVLSTAGVLRGEMAELRGEMAALAAELRGEMADLRAELRGEMAELRADVRTEIAGLQRWMAAVVVANAVTVISVLVTS